MNRIQQELMTSRTLNAFLRESDYAFLERLSDRIMAALDDKKAAHLEEERQQQMREEKRAALLEMNKSEGFSLADLTGAEPVKIGGKRKPKYQYEENGTVKKWSGVGRTPVAIQRELDAGKSLDDFLTKRGNV